MHPSIIKFVKKKEGIYHILPKLLLLCGVEQHEMDPMNVYGDIFAEVYNLYWTQFIDETGPQIIEIFKSTKHPNHHILDLCCGTGRLSKLLVSEGFHVTGIDLSKDMIEIANKRLEDEINRGLAQFIIDDAVSFELDETFGMVASTFDSLNHLYTLDDLQKCFRQVYKVLEHEGIFLFDLNTEKGLKSWDLIDVEEHVNTTFILHGKYDRKEKRAYVKVFGFKKHGDCYQKFEEIMYNTVFKIKDVIKSLEKVGYRKIELVTEFNLQKIVKSDKAENEDRVFIIAKK